MNTNKPSSSMDRMQIQPMNICRCCLSDGCYKDISTEYHCSAQKEVYADMLKETFNIEISYQEGGGPSSQSRLICEQCITRLRDAFDFKEMVVRSEGAFLERLKGCDKNREVPEVEEDNLKYELVKAEMIPAMNIEEKCTDNTQDDASFDDVDDDEDAESEDEGPPRPKRGRNKQWVFQFQFSNMKEAEEFVNAENTWSRKFTRTTEEGQKRFYRCNKVKKKGPQCAAELYLLFDCKSNDVLVYNIDAEHTHDEIGARGCGIDEITKMEINRLSSLRLKPKAILSALENMVGIKVPTKMQLNNYLNDRRRSNLGQSTIKSTIHLGELENWINEHTTIPEDENETFVMKHLIFKNDQPNFRFVLTTIKLLKFAHSCDVVHADAIHKLIWQGFPVLIVGATNRNREFFPICLAVSTNEQEDDFQMIFSALKEKIRSIFDQDFQPKVLVCDSSQAIKNAFLHVFGSDTTVRVCWTQAKRNIQKKVEQTIEKTTRKDVLQDVDALHNAPSGELFNAASRAFIAKHATHTAFIEYFEQQWLIENPYWFLGAATPSPVTNNALESFNKTIKDHNTLRERFSLSHFLAVVSEMVTQWSNQISDTLPVTLKFDLQEWTEGYLWAKKNVEIKILSSDATNSVYLAPSESTIRIKDTNTTYESWQTFDEYRERNFAFWRIELPRAEWTNGTCTCPQFIKKYMCKHILGLAIRLNLASPPLEAKIIPSPQNRKRGRPSKSKPALIL